MLAEIPWRCMWAAKTLQCPWFAMRLQSQAVAERKLIYAKLY